MKNLILRETVRYVEINVFPDFDISEYQGPIDSDYYFHNTIDIPYDFKSLLNVTFDNHVIFSFNDIDKVKKKFNLNVDNKDEVEEVINKLIETDDDLALECFFEPDLDEFKLKELRLKNIDNNNRKIHYEGTFFGASYMIDQIDWNLFSQIKFIGIPFNIAEFYKELISESYVLKLEGNKKMSYFIMYSALENYIEYKLGSNEEKRLSEKITELFSICFQNITKHQIYSCIINDYKTIKEKRNDIAHGNMCNIKEEDLNKIFLFVLIVISTIENKCETFDELHNTLIVL